MPLRSLVAVWASIILQCYSSCHLVEFCWNHIMKQLPCEGTYSGEDHVHWSSINAAAGAERRNVSNSWNCCY